MCSQNIFYNLFFYRKSLLRAIFDFRLLLQGWNLLVPIIAQSNKFKISFSDL
jgi:hypothetical protein